ncbi:S-layer homology domain-containing protein [Cohnella soli]|uniref:S-layer homology domain-containing protein n=1 Tax=Cohnella soli TaxID=425005 RepID=A0ABW0HTQ7_9BACL
MKSFSLKKPKRLLSLALATVLALPAFGAGIGQASAAAPPSVSSHYDYFKDVYTNLKNVDSHIFKTITYEDLVTILGSKGTFAILIGGAWSDETQADIGYINEVAKANGVKEIYNFDTRLDGASPGLDIAVTHDPLTATSVNGGNTTTNYFDYTEYYVELVNKYLTNLTTLSSVSASYVNKSKLVTGTTPIQSSVVAQGSAKAVQSPYLLIYNKDHKLNGENAPVVSYLEKHGPSNATSYTWDSYFKDNATNVTNYKAQVKAVFDEATTEGYAPNNFDKLNSWDFIGPQFNSHRASGSVEIFPSKTVDGKVVPDLGANNEYEIDSTLVFEHVTYHEVNKLLASSGRYALLFGGSWCPNTQAEIRWINRYAKAHNIDKIYFFDTRLDAGVGMTVRTPTASTHDDGTTLQIRDHQTANPLAYLYGALVEANLKNIQTSYLITSNSKVTFIDPATSQSRSVNKLQVPYLFTFDKDYKDSNNSPAPILGHVEIMNTWPNTYTGTGAQYSKYDAAANSLFSRFEGVPPTGFNVVGVSAAGAADGQITGVSGGGVIEYRLKPAEGQETAFTPITGTTVTGLAAGTYQVRFASKGFNTSYNQSTGTGTVTYAAINNNYTEVTIQSPQLPPTGLHGVKPTTTANDDGKVTIDESTAIEGLQYSASQGGASVDVSTRTISSLQPGTYYFWYASKPGFNQSEATEVIVPSYSEVSPPSGLTAKATTSLENNDGQIEGVTASDYTLQIKKQSDAVEAYTNAVAVDGAIKNLTPGVYHVRYDAHGELQASQPVTLTVRGNQASPTGLLGVAPTAALNDGQITGVSSALEYRIKDTGNYQSVTGSVIAGLAAGSYEVRAKQTELYVESASTTVNVPAYVPPTTTPTTPTAPTTTTPPVDNSGVVSTPGSGNTGTVTAKAPAKTDAATGDTLANLSKETAASIVSNVKKSEAEGRATVVEVKVETTEQTKSAQLSIPKESFAEIATGTKANVKVEYGNVGTISFDPKAVQTINAATGTGNVSIIIAKSELTPEGKEVLGDRPVYDFTVFVGNDKVSSFGGGVANISLPYTLKAGENPESVVVYYVNDAGELETVRGQFNAATGTVNFSTKHFSQYIIAYNAVTFDDVAATSWYGKAVSYLAARDITGGTDDTHFSPNAALTRGQFIVLLLKAYGIQAAEAGADNFADAGNKYYTGYLAAAKKLGIATGIGDNQFAPDQSITRQELFTLLYRSLGLLGELPSGKTGATVSSYNDANQISVYAQEAIQSLVESGVISGSNDKLDPRSVTTRAQVAQVLYNLLSK